MDVSSSSPPHFEPRFQIGAIITHPGADAAPGEDIDLVVQLVALHVQHAQPYEHGWLSGAR